MSYDIHGNPTNRDVHGNPADRNIHGNSPSDVHGNPWGGKPLVGAPNTGNLGGNSGSNAASRGGIYPTSGRRSGSFTGSGGFGSSWMTQLSFVAFALGGAMWLFDFTLPYIDSFWYPLGAGVALILLGIFAEAVAGLLAVGGILLVVLPLFFAGTVALGNIIAGIVLLAVGFLIRSGGVS